MASQASAKPSACWSRRPLPTRSRRTGRSSSAWRPESPRHTRRKVSRSARPSRPQSRRLLQPSGRLPRRVVVDHLGPGHEVGQAAAALVEQHGQVPREERHDRDLIVPTARTIDRPREGGLPPWAAHAQAQEAHAPVFAPLRSRTGRSRSSASSSQPPASRAPARHAGRSPPTSAAIRPASAASDAKATRIRPASIPSATARVAIPAYGDGAACWRRSARSSNLTALLRRPTTSSSARPIICLAIAARTLGPATTSSIARRI